MQESTPVSISMAGKGLLIEERIIEEDIKQEPVLMKRYPAFPLFSTLRPFLPKTRSGISIKVVDFMKYEHSLWYTEVWHRGEVFPKPFFERRRQNAMKRAARFAGEVIIEKVRVP